MHVAERQDYHLIDDLWFSYKILKIPNFAGGFLSTSFSVPMRSGPDFSEMNSDADLILFSQILLIHLFVMVGYLVYIYSSVVTTACLLL